MAIRYFIKYFDIEDIEHRLNIYDDDYTGDAVQVDGRVFLTYAETDNPLEAIRGQGLRVDRCRVKKGLGYEFRLESGGWMDEG